jgi:hypothetical protein
LGYEFEFGGNVEVRSHPGQKEDPSGLGWVGTSILNLTLTLYTSSAFPTALFTRLLILRFGVREKVGFRKLKVQVRVLVF